MTPPSRARDAGARAWAGGEDRPDGPSLQLTSFVGRGRELGEIEGLLERSWLLTLTGPGGCGKTRLALALGDRVAGSFADSRCLGMTRGATRAGPARTWTSG